MNIAVLTLTKYKGIRAWAGFHSMPAFRIPLSFNPRMDFFKLMGCGKNGVFNLQADWNQYGIFTVSKQEQLPEIHTNDYEQWRRTYYGGFLERWWKINRCETWTLILQPIRSQGTWDGKNPFEESEPGERLELTDTDRICVLTRATIKPLKSLDFWRNVGPVQEQIKDVPGLLFSIGLGEMPLLRQATVSVWDNQESMKSFAYRGNGHREVIEKTRQRKWYSEEMFTRFRVLKTLGTLNGDDPLKLGLPE